MPIDTSKQSITVNFYELEKLITVNNPIANFWGCVGFYGLIFGSIIYAVISCWIFIVKEKKKSRR